MKPTFEAYYFKRLITENPKKKDSTKSFGPSRGNNYVAAKFSNTEGGKQTEKFEKSVCRRYVPLDEECDGTENGGGEHEAVGDEDVDVHTIVERELDADL